MTPLIISILGEQAAAIIGSLAKAQPELSSYLIPRIIISWLRQSPYGELPGHGVFKSLSKSGYGFSGGAVLEGSDFAFSNLTEEHLTALATIVSGLSISPIEIKDIDLARLSKTLDLLVKAKITTPDTFEHTAPAQNLQPAAPLPPDDPKSIKTNKIKIPGLNLKKPNPIKLTRSETQEKCAVCGNPQFVKNDFVGCICFKPLVKNTKVKIDKDQFVLYLDNNWDPDAILALARAFKHE